MKNSIYCSATDIKVMIGKSSAGKVEISNKFEEPLPDGAMINGIITNEKMMIDFLSIINRKIGASKNTTRLVIDTNNISTKIMEVPILQESQILEFIKREFTQYQESDAEQPELIYDYTVLEPRLESGGASILAVSVGKELLESYEKVFVNAGYDLEKIDIATNCQIKLAKSIASLNEGSNVWAIIDGAILSLTLFNDGKYNLTNKYRLLNAEGTPEWVSDIGNNISSMLQFNKSVEGTTIGNIYLSGLSAEQVKQLNDGLSYLEIGLKELPLKEYLNVSSDIAGNYLYNIGSLL